MDTHQTTTVAIISDSHDLVRPEIENFLRSSDLVVHAGDVGSDQTLEGFLSLNDDITLVRGNVDLDTKVSRLPERAILEVEGRSIHIVHDITTFSPGADAPDIVVFGHSHRPLEEKKGNTLFVNPGSIGPRRFSLPISYASLDLAEDVFSLQFHTIAP
ncbi:MAG TPA: YfcE family phosphodiesterase [Candidatus Latescibacteria bacterium]|nr:YfcE family phosphodiesterase [Gemmatimonadota bacterium]HCR16422.1 YfcE family phosphodiesterase [Candidatus Latescibacterota bacterium]|tara:strand:+ start:384 stop:857 length:474 start_codon:yes stop_codon:yes gene_type:complete